MNLRNLLLCLTLTLWSYSVPAQDSESVPDAPVDLVRDEARTLNLESKKKVVQQLRQFVQQTGLQVYVDTNAFLLGSQSAAQRARMLVGSWLDPQRPGFVLCVNRGTSVVPVLQHNEMAQRLFPHGELDSLNSEIRANVDAAILPEDKMPVAVQTVIQRLNQLVTQRQSKLGSLTEREWLMG
jgi:hypothetical protein